MVKKAKSIILEYKQIKNADNYLDGLTPLYEAIWEALPESAKTVDLGCAYGLMAVACKLRGDDVIAMDMTDKFTNLKMMKKLEIPFKIYNLEKEEPQGELADLIIFTEILEHLNSNPLPSIKKIHKMLKPNGTVVCTTPAKEIWGDTTSINDNHKKGLWNHLDRWKEIPEYKGKWRDQHTFHYDQFELVSLFAEADFNVVDTFRVADFSNLVIARKV